MNYRSFRKQMVDAFESMQEDESGILIMLDGDHFKQINDNYGHNAEISQSIAKEAVKRKLSPVTLSAGAVIARHGDSFVTLSKLADAALYLAKESHIRNINL